MGTPLVSVATAVRFARDVFGIDGEARPLPGERDANFHLIAHDGHAFVLKVADAAEDPAIADLQTRALRHIAARDSDLPVPHLCPTVDGRDAATMYDAGGVSHIVRMLTYLPGVPLHRSEPSVGQAAALGGLLARLTVALRDFSHPAADHELLWDLSRAPRLRELLGGIADARLRALATRVLDRYDEKIAPSAAAVFRRQVVHNDGNPHNVLVDPVAPGRVTGIIDFGDLVRTALVNDVAIAAAYQLEGDDPLARPLALIGGYHAACPLQPVERDGLLDLIALRHVQTIAIGEWLAGRDPANRPYLLRNHARAAAALDTLERTAAAAWRQRLDRACDGERAP